jgi:uncharacterized protein YuzE
MGIQYDREADALYIRSRDEKPADNVDVEDGLTIDLDHRRRPIGIEILYVSKRFPPDTLQSVTIENFATNTP